MNYIEFWDNNHKNKSDLWLSSSYTGEDILNLHSINKNISGLDILDLGIGVGNLTTFLSLKNNVYACDISEVALDNVKNIAKTYNSKYLKNIEPVDLAISNLVFQHCNDKEVERFINDINLKPNGIFSFQFAFLRENEEPKQFVKNYIQKNTHFFRPLATILDYVEKSNKKILSISEPIHHYGPENFSWYIVKITNKS